MEKKAQGREFVCKHCQQRCLSGKSLGGHMRRHLALIYATAAKDNKAKAESDDMDGENGSEDDILGKIEENGCSCRKVSTEQQSQQPKTSLIQEKMEELMSVGIGSGDQDQDSYDLRENPKKSWKISDVRAGAYPCKECEKSFPSSRALAGHMRSFQGHRTTMLGPKTVKLFSNKEHMGFSNVNDFPPSDTAVLSEDNLKGKPVILKYVKFQNVRSLTIFIEDNQSGSETTKIQKIVLYGTTVETTDMKALKKIEEH